MSDGLDRDRPRPAALTWADGRVVALAAAAWFGATLARPWPLWCLVGAIAVAVRHPRLLWWALVLTLATSTLAARSEAGLTPVDEGDVELTATLVTDPEQGVDGRLRFEVSTADGRLLVESRSPAAIETLAPMLAGEQAVLRGRRTPFTRVTEWTTSRHLRGRLRVESVGSTGQGSPLATTANRYRRLLDRGAGSLDPTSRSLLAGLVLGDDRGQPPQLTADFRAAGLTHLLAVSGQNVAFVLAVAGPLLRRVRIWPRLVLALSIVAAFALMTRFEPSVVRAAFVAAVALGARTVGRPSGGVRHLGLAVCVLLVIDPLLVHSLGFRLSVAASAGVLVLAPRIAAHLRGPGWVREGLAVTTGAQLAVAPVLVPAVGAMPLAALPANVAAGPLAGVLMVWGLAAGTVAGVAGGALAWLLHRPSAFGVAALEQIASVGASLPAGRVDLRHLLLLAMAVLLSTGRERLRPLAVALATVTLLVPILHRSPAGPVDAGWAATVWVDGPVAVVELSAGASAVEVLDALRRHEIAAVGLVVSRSSRSSGVAVVEAIESRYPVGGVLGPPGFSHPDVVVPTGELRIHVGAFLVHVDRPGPPMRVRIGWHHAGSADGAGIGAVEVSTVAPAAVGSPSAPGARSPPVRRDTPRRRDGHPQPDS